MPPSLRETPVGTDDAMPWQVDMDGRQNMADEARRAGVDVAIGADKPSRDRSHPADDPRRARLEAVRVPLTGAARTHPAMTRAHREAYLTKEAARGSGSGR